MSLLASNNEYQFGDNVALAGQRFKSLSTLKVAFLQSLFFIAFCSYGVYLLISVTSFGKPCDRLVILLFCQAFLWVFSLLIDHYYKWRHHFLQLDGHFAFYGKVNKNYALLLNTVSLGNTIIILTIGIILLKGQDNIFVCEERGSSSLHFVLCLEVILETLSCLLILFTYIVRVYQFNHKKPLNDIDKFERRLIEPGVGYEVGYRYEGEAIADLLEKYLYLLTYYKAANDELCRLLERLQHG